MLLKWWVRPRPWWLSSSVSQFSGASNCIVFCHLCCSKFSWTVVNRR